ncbi:hypothetical protein ElyMa_002952900 [Elysia marginata]|uniref:Uncharacterized protein n=1 Tax=Elysia marginata TaxID=1093978 RepID=A0AAV4I6R6_9GAST|nr:hypothetical protein ElyMa_002952900 [Elysia marginata]
MRKILIPYIRSKILFILAIEESSHSAKTKGIDLVRVFPLVSHPRDLWTNRRDINRRDIIRSIEYTGQSPHFFYFLPVADSTFHGYVHDFMNAIDMPLSNGTECGLDTWAVCKAVQPTPSHVFPD